MTRLPILSLAAALCIFTLGYNGSSAAAPDSPRFKPARCFSATGLTDGATMRCGTVQVPMGGTSNRDLTLFVTIIGRNTADAKQALFHIPGGPGASAESYAPILASTYLPLSETIGKPIIFVDQRGTGRSKPFLDCTDLSAPAACQAAWAAAKIDPLTFTTPFAADDIAAVASALGLTSIDAWGASYGSRLALETVRRHGDLVRSLVIESVDTADSPLDDALDVRAALTRVGAECAGNPECQAVIPNLVAATDAAAVSLAKTPLVTQLGTVDTATFLSDVSTLMEWARGTSFVPAYIAAVRDRNLSAVDALRGAIATMPSPGGQFSAAMYTIVNCTDLAPFKPATAISRHIVPANDLLGQARAAGVRDQYSNSCAGWPVDPNLPTQPVKSNVPTLVLSGAIDSNTPLEDAQRAAASLSNARMVVSPSTGHFPVHQGENPCGTAILAAFFANPTAPINSSCLEAARPMAMLPSTANIDFKSAQFTALGFNADVPEGWLSLDRMSWRTAGGVLQFARLPGRIGANLNTVSGQLGLDPTKATPLMIGDQKWTQVGGPGVSLLVYPEKASVLMVVAVLSDGSDAASLAKRAAQSIATP